MGLISIKLHNIKQFIARLFHASPCFITIRSLVLDISVIAPRNAKLMPHNFIHYNDVIMSAMATQITCLSIKPFVQAQIKENFKLCITDRWIPLTKAVTRKNFPFDDVTMHICGSCQNRNVPRMHIQSLYSDFQSRNSSQQPITFPVTWFEEPPNGTNTLSSWWRHTMETFSASLAFVRGIHRPPVNSSHKVQWRGALMFSLICAWKTVK